jgi:hypothetical protein
VFDLHLRPTDRGVEISPWPFTGHHLRVEVEGRLLRETFTDQEALRAALERAPAFVSSYDLWAA